MVQDIVTTLKLQISKVEERIKRLEEESSLLSSEIEKDIESENSNNESDKSLILAAENQIKLLKSELRVLIKMLVFISNKFKNLVKKEHLEALNSRVDDFPIENFITRDEFVAMIKSRL